MTDIYEDHDRAFKHVAAYVVTDSKGDRVATVAFKYAASGLRTTCYFHVIGLPMTKAFAGGGGYDKASAAAKRAVMQISTANQPHANSAACMRAEAFQSVIKDEGRHWDDDLRAAGFTVLQAV